MKKVINIYHVALALLVTTMLFLISLLGSGTAYAAPAKDFPDLPQTHWAYSYVGRLSGMGAIAGMPDGRFYPNNNITRAEFVKIVVGTTIGDQPAAADGSHWAVGYMQAAVSNKLLEEDEFAADTWNNPIIRQDMAKIVARAMEFVLKEQQLADTSSYTAKITDWAGTCEVCKPYIAQAYAKGIIAGYPDGSFGGTKNATRAEAVTMIIRLMDPAYRVQSNAAFNPSTDVAADGRMKLAKAEEYMMQTLQSLQFYKEGSKYYVKGDLPDLPAGFENYLDVVVQYKSGTGLHLDGPTTYTFVKENLIDKEGSFVYELKGMSSVTQVDFVKIDIAVDAPRATNDDYQKNQGFYSITSSNQDKVALVDATNFDRVTYRDYDFNKMFTWK